eukprot:320424_1
MSSRKNPNYIRKEDWIACCACEKKTTFQSIVSHWSVAYHQREYPNIKDEYDMVYRLQDTKDFLRKICPVFLSTNRAPFTKKSKKIHGTVLDNILFEDIMDINVVLEEQKDIYEFSESDESESDNEDEVDNNKDESDNEDDDDIELGDLTDYLNDDNSETISNQD